jgi:hypothetical protein
MEKEWDELNIPEEAPDGEEQFSLEEILAEYGSGRSAPDEAPPPPPADEPVRPSAPPPVRKRKEKP